MYTLTDYNRLENVAYGATLGGIQYHAGTIAGYLKSGVDKTEYDSDALLSFFCGNFSREASFSLFFGQTRVRAIMDGQATPLMFSYLSACLETAGLREHMHPSSPTYFRQQFIERLQTGDWSYRAFGRHKVDRAQPRLWEQTHRVGLLWNQGRLDAQRARYVPIYMALCATDITFDTATQKYVGVRNPGTPLERQQRTQPHTHSRPEQSSAMNQDNDTDMTTPFLSVDMAKFGDAPQRNPLFAGLVQDYPGWYPFEIEADFEDEIEEEVDFDRLIDGFLSESTSAMSLGMRLSSSQGTCAASELGKELR
jgi:hypothetical protein